MNLNKLFETFQYDHFDRLTEYRIFDTNQNQLSLVEMGYTENGNIEFKSDLGEYLYSNQKPNTVESVLLDSQISFSSTQTAQYNSLNKLKLLKDTIGSDEIEVEILYGADGHRRVMHEYVNGVKVKTTYYSGGYEEVVDHTLQETKKLHYISGNEGLTSVYQIDNSNTGMHYFVCLDHLGSITALIDQNGVVAEERSYDPWGNPREHNNWLNYNVNHFSITSRGYTGHEHLQQFGLINMNGRMYDPILARMLSPDPGVYPVEQSENGITNPTLSQDYNRYSYVLNNPLKYTDPSGYIRDKKRYKPKLVPRGTQDELIDIFNDPFDYGEYWDNLWGNNADGDDGFGGGSGGGCAGSGGGRGGGGEFGSCGSSPGVGDPPVLIGVSVDATIASPGGGYSVAAGWIFNPKDYPLNSKLFYSYGVAYGLEASLQVNVFVLVPEGIDFNINDFEGLSWNWSLTYFMSLTFSGDSQTGYPEDIVGQKYKVYQVGYGVGGGNVSGIKMNTKFVGNFMFIPGGFVIF